MYKRILRFFPIYLKCINMGSLSQLGALLWKSLLLKGKSPIGTFFEFFSPVVILWIVLGINADNPMAYVTMVLFFAFSISLGKLAFIVVTEREQRIAEMMKILGLSSWIHYASWFIFYTLVMTIVSVSISVTLVLGEVFKDVNIMVYMLFFLSYCTSAIAFSLALSTLFDSARAAQTAGFLVLYMSQLMQFLVEVDWSHEAKESLAFFFPPVSFALGTDGFSMVTSQGPLDFSTWDRTYPSMKLSISRCVVVMSGATVFYLIMYVYLDQVVPHEIGVRKHPLFFIKRFLGLFSRSASEEETVKLVKSEQRTGVEINGLSKRYDGSATIALSPLDVELQLGEMTVLLGRNGAGKSTLISLLTGMHEPTSGHARVLGHLVPSEMDEVRENLGYCPQHDVQWPTLSVEDHMSIFGKIRGLSSQQIRERQAKLLTVLGLAGKEKAPVQSLSGGMKRKLSVACAFLGDSRFVILDEPTSGLDPVSRRELWSVLGKLRSERVILLSTHYMDEAEVLGDRVLILADGVLKANGTVHELKRDFNCGYDVVFETVKSGSIDRAAFDRSVKSVVGTVATVSLVETGIKVVLPMDAGSLMQALLLEIRDKFGPQLKEQITVTSRRLDEVFMRIADSGHSLEIAPTSDDIVDDSATATPDISSVRYPESSSGLLAAQIVGTVIKRYHMFVRDLRISFFNLFLPLLMIGVGVFVTKKIEKDTRNSTGSKTYADAASGFVMLGFLVIAFASVGSNMAASMSTERHSNSKFLQYVSGISPVAFWTGSLIADLVEYLLFPVSVTIIMIAALEVTIKLESLTMLLVLFGPAVIAQTYLLAAVLPSRNATRWVSMILNVMGGMVLPLVTMIILRFSDKTGDSTKKTTFEILEYIFCLIPAYNLGAGLLTVNMWSWVRLVPAGSVSGPYWAKLSAASSPLQYDVAGSYLLWLAVCSPLYMGLTIWIDNMIYKHQFASGFRSAPAGPIEDDSVSRERGKLSLGSQETILRVMDVSKQYGSLSPWVVHRVPLAVSRNGEIFTILGENGAGKSTLIKMAIGEILPTDGDVWADQFNTKKEIKKFRHLIGYCPQFDALIDVLTVKDHLGLYARIKGLSGSAVEIAADHMIEWIGIGEYRNVKAKALSGGYKRRLSLGIALMGNPSLVFLDEPSCGMDPVARRQIWKVIHSASQRFSLVLTTHSMEEAENVSTRIGIMSRGHMMCMGTIPELREKFSNGVEFFIQTKQVVVDPEFTAQILASSEPPLATCQRHSEKRRRRYLASGMTMLEASKEIMSAVFAEWWLQEEANDQIETIVKDAVKTVEEFEASGRSIRASVAPVSKVIDVEFVGSVFAVLEKLRTSGLIEDYSVTQNSLEQVFRSIAAREEAPRVTELLE